jgi:hypothetical protein
MLFMGRKANQTGHFTIKSDINTIINTTWQVKIASKSCFKKNPQVFLEPKKNFSLSGNSPKYTKF